MGLHKKYRGKRITPKDKNWSRGTWYIWKRIDGRIIHKAIKGAVTKEQAERAAAKIIEKAFNKRYGLGDDTTFGEFSGNQYARYVEQNNINIAAKRLYIHLLNLRFERRALSDISPQDCRDAQADFRKRYSASSVNLIMSTASKIFTLACQENILDRNPMQYVTRLKEPPPRDRLLSKEEKERLWKELEKDELLCRLVTLAINLPLRLGQLLAINADALDLQNGLLCAVGSKGRTSRLIPLNTTAQSTFRLMIDAEQLPFPLKETGIRKRWIRILKRAGIENFRFHDLRREFASGLIRKNVSPETVRQLFAHSSLAVTQVYMASTTDELKAAVNTLDEVQETEGVQ